jgi:vacuolar-type H+-ATPase subunit H
MEPDEEARKRRERDGEFGRLAGKLVKNAGPSTRKFIAQSRPKVEKAIHDTRPKVEKAIEDARPRVQQTIEDYRPKAEQAGRDAVQYAQDHQDELRGMALKGVRMRLGPLGMVIDALGIGGQPAKPAAPANTCAQCSTVNSPAARFCSECGAQLGDGPQTTTGGNA